MPNYQAQNPPFAIYPGDRVYAFNAESPAVGQASQEYAIGAPYGVDDPPAVGVDIIYASAPTSVQVDIQTSIDDVDSRYQTIYSSTKTGGEHVNIVNLKGGFVRAKLVAQSGGGAVTVEFLR